MFKPIKIKTLDNCKLWLRFEDSVEGTVDLSHLAGKGVFSFWNNPENFKKAHIGKHGEIIWSKEVEICSDNLYLQITGKKAEEVFRKEERLSA